MDQNTFLPLARGVIATVIVIARTILPRGKSKGRTGVVQNISFTTNGKKEEITVFEIHEFNGDIYYGGILGHTPEFSNEDTLEFWPSDVQMGRSISGKLPADVATSQTKMVVCHVHHGLRSYRILQASVAENFSVHA